MRSILDTLSFVLAVDAFYKYVVTDFGNPLLLLKIPARVSPVRFVSILESHKLYVADLLR